MTVLQIGAYSLSVPCDLCLPRETPKDSEAHFTGARDKVLAVPFVAFLALGAIVPRMSHAFSASAGLMQVVVPHGVGRLERHCAVK